MLNIPVSIPVNIIVQLLTQHKHCSAVSDMPGGQENSSEVIAERGQIIGMWRAGASVPDIAFEVG